MSSLKTKLYSIFSLVGFAYLLACGGGKPEDQTAGHQHGTNNNSNAVNKQTANNHQHGNESNTTTEKPENPKKSLDFSGLWGGWVYPKVSGQPLVISLQQMSAPTIKIDVPKDQLADSMPWSVRIEFSQKDNTLSGSCTIQETNMDPKPDPIQGKFTGEIDPTKNEITLKLDDNLNEALGANTFFLSYQTSKPDTLSGNLVPDTETKPEESPKPNEPEPSKEKPSPPMHNH